MNNVLLFMENKLPTFSFSLRVISNVSSVGKYKMLEV